MRVALTGASGFIGTAVARGLHAAGHQVTGLVRETSTRGHLEAVVDRWVVGRQDDASCWPALLDGVDCIVHNSVDWIVRDSGQFDRHLQSNLVGSIRLLQASAPAQFVFVSSIAVHHDMRPRWRGLIDEDHPTRPGGWYGAYKASVEAHLWAAHFEHSRATCALRPCAVYGIDPHLERSHGYALIEKLRHGERISRSGGGKFVHVDDVAAAIVACVGNPGAAGQMFNLADCYARWADWASIAAELLGLAADIDRSSPSQPHNVFAKDAARSLGVDLNRGHAGIREHLRQLIELM